MDCQTPGSLGRVSCKVEGKEKKEKEGGGQRRQWGAIAGAGGRGRGATLRDAGLE